MIIHDNCSIGIVQSPYRKNYLTSPMVRFLSHIETQVFYSTPFVFVFLYSMVIVLDLLWLLRRFLYYQLMSIFNIPVILCMSVLMPPFLFAQTSFDVRAS